MYLSFTTMDVRYRGKPCRAVFITREAPNEFYETAILSTGESIHLVNSYIVDSLPKTPGAKSIENVVGQIGGLISELHRVEYNSQEYRKLWHEIKRQVETYKDEN